MPNAENAKRSPVASAAGTVHSAITLNAARDDIILIPRSHGDQPHRSSAGSPGS